MRRRDVLVLLFAATLNCGSPLAEDRQVLSLGILPFNSPLALVKTHAPLRDALSVALGTSVEIYTAPDYPTFLRDSVAGRFDLLITGPHFAVMAIEQGYVPLVTYDAFIQPVFVVRADSSFSDATALRGQTMALSSRWSISSVAGLQWLRAQGLMPERDYLVLEYPSHGAAIAAVAAGEAAAAITTYTPLNQVPESVRSKLRLLAADIRLPHLFTLAHRRLGDDRLASLKAALEAFESSEAGKAFFAQTGYQGYRPLTDADIAAVVPYVTLVEEMLRLAAAK